MLAFGGDGVYIKSISKFPSNFGQACDAEKDFNSPLPTPCHQSIFRNFVGDIV